MWRIWYACFVLGLVLAAPNTDGAARLSMTETMITNGYAAESHQVTTDDGYILGLQRMPYKRGENSSNGDRPVVFVMHGLYGSSDGFIAMGPEYSIGYNLADAGFDVWFGNARGNVHSRAHVTLNPDDPIQKQQFFDFSWEEIGMRDLPAMFDYVLNQTGKEKLHYIGHSQGGTVMLVLGSMRPELQEKLASVHLLAGVGYMQYFPNEELKNLAAFTDIIYAVALSEGIVEVSGDNLDDILGSLPRGASRADLCFGDIKYKHMCDMVGARHFIRQDDDDDAEIVIGGGSLKQIAHFGQNVRDVQFRRFHYGSVDNQDLYGSAEPPLYDLALITADVTMHYTLNDDLLDERDVLAMAAVMPNTQVRKVARESFDHNDFLAALDAKVLVTDYIIKAIDTVHYGAPADDQEETTNGSESTEASTPAASDGPTTVNPVPGAAVDISLGGTSKALIILSTIIRYVIVLCL